MSRRLMILLSVLALAVGVLTPVAAGATDASGVTVPSSALDAIKETKTQTYIVQMAGMPVVAYEGNVKGYPATKPKPGKKINPNSANVQKYAGYLIAQQDAALSSVGGGKKLYNYVYSYNGFAAKLNGTQVNQLLLDPAVLAVSPDEFHTVDTSTTPEFLGLSGEGGVWEMGYTGEDIIIGIIDSGIWPESLSFTDRTGSNKNDKDGKLDYKQIPGWHGKCTPGEDFDASMCNQKLIGAQYFNAGQGGNDVIDAQYPWEFNSPRDYNGHGTHTASTSGGNADVAAKVDGIELGAINGIAPRARIASYKALWSNEDGSSAGGFTADLVAAIDQAVADGVDVINYSISGSRAIFMDAVEISFLFAADAGVFVAASAGNSGPGANTVAHNSPWLTTVAAGTHDRFYEGTVTLGNAISYSGASIDSAGAGPADLIYGGDAGDSLCYPGNLDPELVAGKIVVCDRGAFARVAKSQAVQMAGGVGMVHANTNATESINADLHFVPTVHVNDVDGAAIRAYAQTPSATATLTGGVLESVEAPFVAGFSSRGPAIAGAGDVLKPDILAPGVDILAAVAPPGNAGKDFDLYSGTSMSSPHIAGIAAVIMDAHPDWTPMMVKSAITTTATQETNMGNTIPGIPFDYGAGHVVPSSALDPGLVYDAGWTDWLGFLCGTGELNASYCPNIGIDPSDLNVPSIAIGALAGEQTVTRTVTNVGPTGTYTVSAGLLAGIDIDVSPNTLTLVEGESKSFDVTFKVNSSVSYNTYSFGSLTWSQGEYSVTSPLAIQPVLFAAPAEVQGSDLEGSLSFDVTFGYTGDYAAGVHGLVAADVQAGNVADDPTDDINQALDTCDFSSFPASPPFDCVGITWHEFEVAAGSSYARFSLFDDYTDGADDLDLYVFRPGLVFVGGSGSGTSAEQVDVLDPDSGTYWIAVHGWGTDGPDSNYTLFGWDVGGDEGNMTVDGPGSAVAGVDTVTVDWFGLSTDTKYLGAVSHSDASDVLGLTLVAIATD